MSDGKVVIQITADPSDYEKAIGSLGASTQKSLATAIKGSFIGNLFAQAFSKAAGVIANSMDAAISRVDIMKNFPRVMESLGYSADDASTSIQKMSDHLTGLPTRLDTMTASVQKIVPTVKDVGKATDIMLAFNDALLAGGASTQVQEAALEQFSQVLAKGKPELEDWRSIQTAMPGQLDQVAQSMLGQGASATDLYEALKSGKVTMGDFCDAIVRLDTEGGQGFASFAEQAKLGTQGIGTSFSNLQNSVVKGLASILDAVGSENIVGVMEGANKAITGMFKAVASAVSGAMPSVVQIVTALSKMGPQVLAAVAGFAGFKSAGGIVSDVAGRLGQLEKGAGLAAKASAVLGRSISPVGIALTVGAAAVGLFAGAVTDYVTNTANARKATEGLNQAAANTAALGDYGGAIQAVGSTASQSAPSIAELNSSIASSVDAMERTTSAAQQQVDTLSTAQSIIQQYAGHTDLSAESQGRLQWALEEVNNQFGMSLTAADAASNSYKDQDGNVKNLTDSVNGLIEAKKREIQLSAMQDNYTEALKRNTEAEEAYAAKVVSRGQDIQDTKNALIQASNYSMSQQEAEAQATEIVDAKLGEYKSTVDNTTSAVNDIASAMGDASKATSDSADAYDRWGNTVTDRFGTAVAILKQKLGANGLGQLKDDLRDLGASTEDLGNLTADQMQELALAYDGTSASIVGKLAEWGVGMDDAKAKTAEGVAAIRDALNGMGVGDAFSQAGIDIDAFSQKLAEAGVSAEQLNAVGSENLSALAQSCNGNTDQMIAAITAFNGTPMLDKNSGVYVYDTELTDAQGNVYTWNGTALVDKNGTAIVQDTSLTDAQGHNYVWNGTALVSKQASANIYGNASNGQAKGQVDNTNSSVDRMHDKSVNASVSGNAADGSAASNIWSTVSAIGGLVSKKITTTVEKIITEVHNARGGIRPHADGGFVPRFHAKGAIATKAVPLDIVGEDGAEAIVPLTNERYARPFAQMIAREVDGMSTLDLDIDQARAELAMQSATQYALLGQAFMQGIQEVTLRLDGVNQRLDRIERKMDREVSVRIDSREFGRLVRGVR